MQFIMRKANGDAWMVWTQGGRLTATGLGSTGGYDPSDATTAIEGRVAPLWPVTDERAKYWLDQVEADAQAGG